MIKKNQPKSLVVIGAGREHFVKVTPSPLLRAPGLGLGLRLGQSCALEAGPAAKAAQVHWYMYKPRRM